MNGVQAVAEDVWACTAGWDKNRKQGEDEQDAERQVIMVELGVLSWREWTLSAEGQEQGHLVFRLNHLPDLSPLSHPRWKCFPCVLPQWGSWTSTGPYCSGNTPETHRYVMSAPWVRTCVTGPSTVGT